MKTIDDRGQLVRISGRLPWRDVRRTSHELPSLDLDPLIRLKRERLAVRSFAMELAVGLVVFVAALAGLTWFRITAKPASGISWLSNCAILAGQLAVTIVPVVRLRRRNFAPQIAAAGICPACTHRLRGLPSELDGCTVCPECGAAWHVSAWPHGPQSNPSD